MTNIFLHKLIGTWFIIGTNFPMWLKGDKLSPSFSYALSAKKGKEVLYDEVRYTKKGRTKTIKGYDFPDDTNERGFTWKGKGLLFVARSHWQVRLLDEKEEWAVIWFSGTVFTPEGIDLISRKRTLSAEMIRDIKNKMENDELLKNYVNQLILLQ